MIINGSPDISLLSVQCTFDLSGTLPVISLVNISAGSNLQGCSWAFVAISPSLTPIHNGNILTPDIAPSSSVWSTFSLTDAWPRNPFNPQQIEWSGNPYMFYVIVKDSLGNIFTTQYTELQTALIIPPPNVSADQLSYYGIASSSLVTQCNNGAVFFQNTTNGTYNGNAGTIISSTLKVAFPLDGTGNQMAPFNLINYSSALVPVTINSPNYQFVQNTVYNYNFGGNVYININYQLNGQFGVWCNVNLLPLVALVNKYFYQLQTNQFTDNAAALKRGVLILSEYILIVTGVVQPLAGACDIPQHIMNIQNLTGWDCFDACCAGTSGIVPQQASSIIGGYNFIVNKTGGSINPASNFSVAGNNITLNIGDVTYIVQVTDTSPSDTTALTCTPNTTGATTTYTLQLSANQLALDLPSAISGNAEAYNLWLALFGASGANFDLMVNGGCIFSNSASFNYTFGLTGIPANTTFAFLTSISLMGNNPIALNYAFNEANLSGLQGYLNTLGLGTFAVTGSAGNVSITSTANPNNIIALAYSISSIPYQASITKSSTGYVPLAANTVVQNIINYLCNINDAQVQTSEAYTICYINALGVQSTTVVPEGQLLSTFIQALLVAGCTTVSYIKQSGGGANCTNLQQVFPANTAALSANTLLYGFNSTCAGMTPIQLFQYMLTIQDPTTMAAFCEYVALCGAGQPCGAISFDIVVTPSNTSCSAIVGIQYLLG